MNFKLRQLFLFFFFLLRSTVRAQENVLFAKNTTILTLSTGTLSASRTTLACYILDPPEEEEVGAPELELPVLAPYFQENGNIPHGSMISHCIVPGTIALTFDDGPSPYTPHLLDLLAQHNAKATFFILGGAGNAEPEGDLSLLHIINAAGHQLASHTWDHEDLATLSPPAVLAQITQTEDAFRNTLGFIPTYFRCPYLSCGDAMGVLGERGYKIVGVDLDTDDWKGDYGVAERNFEQGLGYGNIVLAHDIKEKTVYELAEFMLELVAERGLRAVTVGECLGEGREGWYRP